MTKIFRIVGVVFLSIVVSGIVTVNAQGEKILSVNAGIHNPKDGAAGFMGSLMFGTAVDEAVDLGLSLEIYRKTYTKEETVGEFQDPGGVGGSLTSTEIEFSRTLLPIMLNLNVKVPGNRYGTFGYFIRGKLGYELLFSKETNYLTDTKESRRYGGFGWGLNLGLYFEAGTRTTLTVTGTFNSCEVSRDKGETEAGLPISENVDVSGLGFQVGVNMNLGR